jgi:hypothetical protein
MSARRGPRLGTRGVCMSIAVGDTIPDVTIKTMGEKRPNQYLDA